MNNHQTARLALKKTASALSDVAEMYLAQKMNEGFFDPALGEYDFVFNRLILPTQNGISTCFYGFDVIFYPTNIADFTWMNELIYGGVAINVFDIGDAKYVPASSDATQMKQWVFVRNVMLHVKKMIHEQRIVDQFHDLVLETQRSFGEFQEYKPMEIGSYPPEMNTAEVVELTMMALIKRLGTAV